MPGYVALLRGINVGGKNLIKMAELKACFEELGLDDVATYIQSGNVLFRSGESGVTQLTGRLERKLAATFDYEVSVFLRSGRQMRAVVEGAPKGFGANAARYRYDVIFLTPPLTARIAMKSVLTKEGVDRAHAGTGVLYFSRLTSRASQSRLSRIVSLPIYKNMTIRNWNTTRKLLHMLEA
ncbi:MAG: DUF1697 domain-containing protein [Actinomycetota bacterium]